MSELIDRFLRYVRIDTESSEESTTQPSTPGQHDLAKLLSEELKELGASDVYYDKRHCYVYATIPSNIPVRDATRQDKENPDRKGIQQYPPAIGFISHMDTSPAVSGANVNPRIIENYDGGDIVLNEKENVVLSPKVFPDLSRHVGEDLIVTDGLTLLGADDKAGVAEIMTMASHLLTHPEIEHGEIQICFTPDEEIGNGVKYFDFDRFTADYAYTVDGSRLGELEYENFNAASADIRIRGRSVHPGEAKGKMKNAILIGYELHEMLPAFENPMYTEGREGFFHLDHMSGSCEEARIQYIIRDHDMKRFREKKKLLENAVAYINDKHGKGTVKAKISDTYFNMIEKIRPHMHLIETARNAMAMVGVLPIENPIRGGTDGAMLSYEGLPCPNLCTGGYNYHGKYEYASIPEMEKTVEILVNIAKIYGEMR